MDANPIFIDTNILVYASIVDAPLHLVARQKIQTLQNTGATLWISRQVLREYLATLSRTQTFSQAISATTLIADIQFFQTRFQLAEETAQVINNLLSLIGQIAIAGRQIHDANIVATMQAYQIPQLLTRNVVDFKRYSHLITVLLLADNL